MASPTEIIAKWSTDRFKVPPDDRNMYCAIDLENKLAANGYVIGKPIWRPISSAPRDGTYVLLAGPSGHVTTPLRAHVGRWGGSFRPDRWITHDDTDDGAPPTLWMPLP